MIGLLLVEFKFSGSSDHGLLPDRCTTVRPEDRLTLGFFKRLIPPDEEYALVDGCREFVLGNEDKALQHLKQATHLADGAYLAGFLALKKEQLVKGTENQRSVYTTLLLFKARDQCGLMDAASVHAIDRYGAVAISKLQQALTHL